MAYFLVHLVYGMNVFDNFVVSSERFQLMEVQKAHFSKRWQNIDIAVVSALGEFRTTDLWKKRSACSHTM